MPDPTGADSARPDPDALLASIQRSEAKARRGRLKVFFGMAPGVGKTYAMLLAGRKAVEEGIDAVIAVVETHGREETKQLVEGQVVIPRRSVDHKGTLIDEMDLEAVLARRPRLALVDELAHTNAPGSRHVKRWQDVEELLAAGIDVFTTVNVQHLESRADTVHQITGVAVRETVPDSMIEAADDIQIVDITPGQLRERLAAGKVYLGDRAAMAAENFFKESNLTALRELALRLTAERVDKQLREIREGTRTSAIWRSGERLLVAVGASPFSARLIRWTRRMAYALDAPWIAVNVETRRTISAETRKHLDENLALARALGAEVMTVPGEDLASTLIRVAQQRNVSQIVVGKPRGNAFLEFLKGGSLIDRLAREGGQIDLYVVPAEPRTGRNRWRDWHIKATSEPREYARAIVVVAAVTVLGLLLKGALGYTAVSLLYLLAVVFLGLFVGRGPILAAASLSALTWDYLFIPPIFTFRIDKLEDGLMFGLFFVIALVSGRLTGRLRDQERVERMRQQRSTALYHLTRAISGARNRDETIREAAAQVQELFGARTAVFTPDEAGRLELRGAATYAVGDKERSAADWVFRNRKVAGRFTDTLPSTEGFYLPLVAGDRAVGVMGLRAPDEAVLSVSQRDLLETFAGQLGLALDRERLREADERARLSHESDKLHRTLLDSVSHELKTPLAVIASAAENLERTGGVGGAGATGGDAVLLGEIQTASRRLQRLVNNLLDMTRLESGAVQARLDWCDISDLVNAAIENAREACGGRAVGVRLPPGLPPIRADFALIEQAVANLIHNAALHTPAEAEITVSAGVDEGAGEAWIAVTDTGPGLKPEQQGRLFDKFYRGTPDKAGGLGLGLSIVRGFAEAHGGRVEVRNQPTGGARFTLFLPFDKHGSVPAE